MNKIRRIVSAGLLCCIVFLSAINGIAQGEAIDPVSSMNGRYSEILQKIHCPEDVTHYGNFKEYGYRAGESWCGVAAENGYLVWANPNWYVWRRKARTSSSNSRPYVPSYDANQSSKNKLGRDCRPVHTSIVVVNPC